MTQISSKRDLGGSLGAFLVLPKPESLEFPLDLLKLDDEDALGGSSSTTSSFSLLRREKATLEAWYLDVTAPLPLEAYVFTRPRSFWRPDSPSLRGVWSLDDEPPLSARREANWSIPRLFPPPAAADSLKSSKGT